MKNIAKQNKKALTTAIVAVIIGLAVLFVLLYFTYRLNNTYEGTRQKEICKEAIRMNAATKIKGDDSVTRMFSDKSSTSDVPCPVIYTEISGTEEQMKKQLAKSMYDSWDMMGEGKLNLFSGKTGEETYCVRTHHITFKSNHPINGFPDYLSKEHVPEIKGNMTYAKYLQCFNTDPEMFKNAFVQDMQSKIDTSQEYGIMFLYAKKGYLHKIWGAWEGAKRGAVAGSAMAAGFALMPDVTVTKGIAIIIIGSTTTEEAVRGYLTGSEEAADWQACVMLFPFNDENLKSMVCTYTPGVQGNRG